MKRPKLRNWRDELPQEDPEERKRTAFKVMETLVLLHAEKCQIQLNEHWDPNALCGVNSDRAQDLAMRLIDEEVCSAKSAVGRVMTEYAGAFSATK
eukprot:CAMPEP_0197232972 /NCGR_PEP_ID=MMETSP1429-20130617/1154_1 /TAXON_ID=49237 /ORGANISM="Chaetoceros  sp., Strain UNC1202" /LENGTH=95 /DNA_ID=CAMNT_0042691133 /DNA_START=63 /DNA_END=350 /DNA_ORIENTATION=-